MTDLRKHLEEIEVKAAESELIANLTTDEDVKIYNIELREYAQRLRLALIPSKPLKGALS